MAPWANAFSRLRSKGSGIPTDLMNDILVAKDQTVYAATTLGLAWSTDHGDTWQFIRGADWIDKVKNRLGGPPQGWQPPTDADNGGGILAEDYCTALAEDADGRLLVGHRAVAGDILEWQGQNASTGTAGGLKKTDALPNEYITGFVVADTGRNAYLGGYGQGMIAYSARKDTLVGFLAEVAAPAEIAMLPGGAVPPSVAELQASVAKGEQTLTGDGNGPPATCLSDDWMTQGDWVGRYGRQVGDLCAANSPFDHYVALEEPITIYPTLGPAATHGDSVRKWLEGLHSDGPSSLWDPFVGDRRQAEWDDHGEAYVSSAAGPGLWINIKIPIGLFRASIYFYPYRAHDHATSREYRDLDIQVGISPPANQPFNRLIRTYLKTPS